MAESVMELTFELSSPLTEEDWDKITDVDFDHSDSVTFNTKHGKTVEFTKVVRCKDCKHFEYDHPYIIQGMPVLGHEVCNAWGNGCKTDENGYCFMAERRTDERT